MNIFEKQKFRTYEEKKSSKKVIIIDDEQHVREILQTYLTGKGWEVNCASNYEKGAELIKRHPDVDVVFLDLLPGERGLALLRQIRSRFPNIMVVVITSHNDISTAVECMKEGAFDYLTKPFQLEKIPLLVERARELKELRIRESLLKKELEEKIETQHRKIRELFLGSLNALVRVLEAKDEYTVGHSRTVASLAYEIAKVLGLGSTLRKKLLIAGHLHDIGKVGIRDDILRKPGPLTREEFEHIRRHPLISEEILSYVIKDKFILSSVRHHHERINGRGYPDGLKGDEIPLGAKILAVADAYEAMTSHRPYRKALPAEIALREIERNKGYHFDPEVVKAFLSIPLTKIYPETEL